MPGEEKPERPESGSPADGPGLSRRAEALLREFRESRLFVQVVLSLGLVALAWVVTVMPAQAGARARAGLTWAATHDYDFAGQWRRANRWADERGGWYTAATGQWSAGIAEARAWSHSLVPPGFRGAAPASPVPATSGTASPAPVSGPLTIMPVNGTVLYGFGWLPQGRQPHEGLDLAAAVGASVVAMSDGTVTRSGTDPALGGFVEVDHGFVVALYGQVSGVKVRPGDKVKQGQPLAVVAKPTGKEGDSAPHLHLEVRATRGGSPVDPAPFLPAGAGVQRGSST